ncbi:MAG TPA: competence protein CoiA family protein, partial [Gammaproteobacteria bacterium]|nr:competence protein CoiA family protein [Gammaproteobacteria bacterium]
MLYALDSGKKTSASPNFNKAICPNCRQTVIPKCGEINIWHWAHKNRFDCDKWSEGETEWHLKYKALFPANQVEVSITHDSRKHRADIVLAS